MALIYRRRQIPQRTIQDIHTLVWLRDDLRLTDNPALQAALSLWQENSAKGFALVTIHAPDEEAPFAPGAASNWWRHHSLRELANAITDRGGRLLIRLGPTQQAIDQLLNETGAKAVYWNRRYEPAVVQRDQKLKQHLRERGFETKSFNGSMLLEPWEILNKQGRPFRVFTPYYNACRQRLGLHGEGLRTLHPAPEIMPNVSAELGSHTVESLRLAPASSWHAQLAQRWHPGEAGACIQLKNITDQKLRDYKTLRDFPAASATSSLSPHLHFGEIGPVQIWSLCHRFASEVNEPFLRQLFWREFSRQLLYHFPETCKEVLNPRFSHFKWARPSPASIRRWQRGQTGIPIVDAGMRELWHTGTMHNRVRMLVGSFLTKNLRYPWQCGAAWFWDTLVDADLANNSMGWQWVGGSGADAAPYFRIFNPVLQAQRFDPEGLYLRQWLPELYNLPNRYIAEPWNAPASILKEADITLGEDYPFPIVDLAESRRNALNAYQQLRDSSQ